MSRLTKLLGKPIEVTIRGEVFSINPLTVRDMDLFTVIDDPNKRVEAMKKVVLTTMKKSVPDATDDEILNLPMDVITELVEAILKANGLEAKTGQDKK